MEKLVMTLVHAARRLRRYFQAHPIKVIIDSPIEQVLNNSGASERLAKWAVKLGAYGITYVPRAEHIAHFLADTLIEIYATPEVANNPRVEDIPESSNAREDLTPDLRAWGLYTDEASNNEGSEAGLILIAPDDVEYSYALRLNFSNSNNDAEYEALLAGLWIAKEIPVKDIHAFVDSKLVASQVEGSYEAKAENRKADALSKLAAVQFDHLSKEVLVEVLNERSVEAQENSDGKDCELYDGRWSLCIGSLIEDSMASIHGTKSAAMSEKNQEHLERNEGQDLSLVAVVFLVDAGKTRMQDFAEVFCIYGVMIVMLLVGRCMRVVYYTSFLLVLAGGEILEVGLAVSLISGGIGVHRSSYIHCGGYIRSVEEEAARSKFPYGFIALILLDFLWGHGSKL
ncbi:reverse transcriptase domain-containing protein [Tanacetum coccineum]